MTKVVINRCYGGFRLSEEAERLYIERKRAKGEEIETFDYEDDGVEHISCYDLKRHDPDLVAVVEELGDDANGTCSKLQIVEIESKIYRISEYDGMERVITPDTNWDWISVED